MSQVLIGARLPEHVLTKVEKLRTTTQFALGKDYTLPPSTLPLHVVMLGPFTVRGHKQSERVQKAVHDTVQARESFVFAKNCGLAIGSDDQVRLEVAASKEEQDFFRELTGDLCKKLQMPKLVANVRPSIYLTGKIASGKRTKVMGAFANTLEQHSHTLRSLGLVADALSIFTNHEDSWGCESYHLRARAA